MLSHIAAALLTILSNLAPAGNVIALAERMVSGPSDAALFAGPTEAAAVQIDLLPDPEGAEALAAQLELRLADHAIPVFVELVPGDAELPPSYRVGVGPFPSFEDAERAQANLAELGHEGFVRNIGEVLGC